MTGHRRRRGPKASAWHRDRPTLELVQALAERIFPGQAALCGGDHPRSVGVELADVTGRAVSERFVTFHQVKSHEAPGRNRTPSWQTCWAPERFAWLRVTRRGGSR